MGYYLFQIIAAPQIDIIGPMVSCGPHGFAGGLRLYMMLRAMSYDTYPFKYCEPVFYRMLVGTYDLSVELRTLAASLSLTWDTDPCNNYEPVMWVERGNVK